MRPPPPLLRGAMPSVITRKFDLEEGPIADDKATFFAAEIGTTQEEAGERATMLEEGEGMCMKLAPSMHTYIGRKACPVAWAGYFADERLASCFWRSSSAQTCSVTPRQQ